MCSRRQTYGIWNYEATQYQTDDNKKRTREVWKSMGNIKPFIPKEKFSMLLKYHNWDFWKVIKYGEVGHCVFLS
jgi:hypothetical protein